MKNKKYRIIKRRTNIMPEHLKRRGFVVKELHRNNAYHIQRVAQNNLDKNEWVIFYASGGIMVAEAITIKYAHELCELGYPCYAYIGSIFVQVYENYFVG